MSNPLSANTKYPFISQSRKPHLDAIVLSDARPPQHLEMKIIAPVG